MPLSVAYPSPQPSPRPSRVLRTSAGESFEEFVNLYRRPDPLLPDPALQTQGEVDIVKPQRSSANSGGLVRSAVPQHATLHQSLHQRSRSHSGWLEVAASDDVLRDLDQSTVVAAGMGP